MLQITWAQNPFMKKSTGYYNYLATKTPYRNVANMDSSPFVYKGIYYLILK